jgi:hypothetical protein
VRAIAGEARSKPSALKPPDNSYDLPTCPEPIYVMVKFDNITFIEDCDDLDLYWYYRVMNLMSKEVSLEAKSFGDSCDPVYWWAPPYCSNDWHHINDDCGPHSVASLAQDMNDAAGDPFPDTVVAALGQTASGGGGGPISIEVSNAFWNTMILNGRDDLVGTITEIYNFASLQEAQQKLGCGREVCVGPGTGDPYASEHYNSAASVCYTLYIFPQAEGSNCAVKQPVYTP